MTSSSFFFFFFFFQAEDGILDFCLSRGLGDVYKGQLFFNLTHRFHVSDPPGFDPHQILYTLGYLTGWHLLLICILRLCSWTFNTRAAGEESIINLWAYHIVGGLIVSPFVLATFFVKEFAIPLMIRITVMCLILFYLVKFARWVGILFAYKVPIFYMILYLCALEVIPWLVLYRLLV